MAAFLALAAGTSAAPAAVARPRVAHKNTAALVFMIELRIAADCV
jgi:hypothetical protein